MNRQTGSTAGQRGQALTEFIVIALALIPLFLLLPLIAKYQDIAHATEMASRYVAFDAIVNNDGMGSAKSADVLAAEVRRRFYSNEDAPIKTGDTAGDFKAHQNHFWRTPQGDPLVRNFGDVRVTFGAGGATPAAGFKAASDGRPFSQPLPINVQEELGLQARGVYTANVSVTLADLLPLAGSYASTYEQFKDIGLTMTRNTSIVVDTWTARDPTQVESRIDSLALFPGSAVRPLKPALWPVMALMEMPACGGTPCTIDRVPPIGELAFWSDVIPEDRKK
jgi:hypothetical protein